MVPPASSVPLDAGQADRQQWFRDEVQAHERSLKAYLRGSFPAVRDVDDVVQESYVRIWRRAGKPLDSVKGFLFRVARNLALDLVRRDRVSPVVAVEDVAAIPAADLGESAVDRLSREEKLVLLGEALATLPGRLREIVFLHKVQGLSQREVAGKLGLSEKTVANQVLRGVGRVERYLRSRGAEFLP